jgi:rod shape-determining protein MreC
LQDKAQRALIQNLQLTQMVDLKNSFLPAAHAVTARVVNRDPGNFESTITIDRGQESGIEKGMAVVAFKAVVVGHVIDSWRGGAAVRVLADPESAVAVRTIKSTSTGIAQGHAGSQDLVVSDFAAGAHVKRGDLVVTSDVTNSVYPPDLAVGTVTTVDVQEAGLGSVVHIKPAVDFDTLEFVDVLRWVPGEGPVVTTTTTSTTTTTTTVPGSSNSSSTSSSTSSTTPQTSTSITSTAPTSGSGG